LALLKLKIINPTSYIALQCFICHRHASWCLHRFIAQSAASSKFAPEFSPSRPLNAKFMVI
ncbi:MAG: hypothetical protein J6V70_01710, partial [Kiritimatiellae bacterium]|nr:hypothetical protein [Kiritimatiellia bacterium]